MTPLNIVLLERDETSGEGTAVLRGPRAAHVTRVLQATPGRSLRVGIVDGPYGTATVVDVNAGEVTLRCVFEAAPPPRPAVDLLLALPRPKVLRRLWPQVAALGVGRIMLTNAERVERNYFDTHLLEPEVYRPLLIAGLQQARDTRLPQVSVHRQFRILVEDDLTALSDAATRLVAHPGEAQPVSAAIARAGRVLLAVGPEGGWNAFELQLLGTHGFVGVTMGARTLRTDTACIALLALVHDALAANTRAEATEGTGETEISNTEQRS